MAQFWRRTEFRVLLKSWNKKLEEAGFEDAEIEIGGNRALKQRATNCYRQASESERDARLEYYRFMGRLVHETTFPTELERLALLRHSEGATLKEIVDELNKSGIKRCGKTIRHIIRRWQMKWGVRTWGLRQMKLKTPIR